MWKILYWFALLLFLMRAVMFYFHCSELQIPQHNNSLGKHNHMTKSQTQLSTETSFWFHIAKQCLNPCKSGNFKLYKTFSAVQGSSFLFTWVSLSLLDKLTTLWFDKLHKHHIDSLFLDIYFEKVPERYSSKGRLLLMNK